MQAEGHKAFNEKYILAASLPQDQDGQCSWPDTCADVKVSAETQEGDGCPEDEDASPPQAQDSQCSCPDTCAHVQVSAETQEGDGHEDVVLQYEVTPQHTGLQARADGASGPSTATLELRLYRKFHKPRLLLHLVDAVQHRLEAIRQIGPYSVHPMLLLCVVCLLFKVAISIFHQLWIAVVNWQALSTL